MNKNAIRERAYFLWQKEGGPEGRDIEFWERARLMEQAAAEPPMVTPLQGRTAADAAEDTAVEQSFPASDPPAFNASVGVL